jgi:beta-lactamase superfamily II metal-dependent hydrolase
MPGPGLSEIRVRMYQVGFGDCFLVSFAYDGAFGDGRRDRQILIDFGTRRAVTGVSAQDVARRIAEHSGGRLDVVVVTHRHQDHLSAFGQAGIPALLTANAAPSLVVRSWTEDPEVAADATAPRAPTPAGDQALATEAKGDGKPGQDSARFVRTLAAAQQFGQALNDSLAAAPDVDVGNQLGILGALQMPNGDAVQTLQDWAEAAKATYLFYGAPSGIEDVVPGVTVKVLGPPTVEQHPEVTTQRESDAAEFWMLYKGLVQRVYPLDLVRQLTQAGRTTAAAQPAADAGPSPEAPQSGASRDMGPVGPVRWLTERMGRQQLNSLLRIARTMDDVLNNTSVILLFEAEGPNGTTRMLFPGDAQIENWEYALKVADDKDENLARLAQLDLYKVGHHGSRNATPHTLFDLWRPPEEGGRPMTALMSTKPGVFGKSEATAVPRSTLVEALGARTTLYSTDTLSPAMPWHEVVADFAAGTSFRLVKPV